MDRKCPKSENHFSIALDIMIVLAVLMLLSGGSYGGFRAYMIYRQRGAYIEQINPETPPVYP